jgi:hypothetical protein
MAKIASYIGVDQIMDSFDSFSKGNQYVSIWQYVSEPMYTNAEASYDEMKSQVHELLLAAEQNGNNNPLTIKFHLEPKEGQYISSKSPVVGSVIVKAITFSRSQLPNISGTSADGPEKPQPVYHGQGTVNFEMYKVLKGVEDLPARIDERMAVILDRVEELEEELEGLRAQPAPVEEDMIGKITGLANNPAVMGAINALVQLFVPAFKPPMPAQINGTADVKAAPDGDLPQQAQETTDEYNDRIDAALERLEPKCDLANDLTLLADMADNNPTMFKFLLKSLRNG